MEVGIERPLTNIEKSNFIAIGDKSPQDIFLKQLADVEFKFIKEHKPFDSQCARLEFKDEVERITRESERRYGYVLQSEMDKLKFENLERYGDMDRFIEISRDEEVEMQNVNNIKQAVKTGYTIKYNCKARGHGISVFIPTVVYEERYPSKKGKKEE